MRCLRENMLVVRVVYQHQITRLFCHLSMAPVLSSMGTKQKGSNLLDRTSPGAWISRLERCEVGAEKYLWVNVVHDSLAKDTVKTIFLVV